MYSHGIIHFAKAEALYESRGWVSKGRRCSSKKLCDATYLYFDEDASNYFIEYDGARIITIHRGHTFTLHKPTGWNYPGRTYRLNAFLPANITAHRGSLYVGREVLTSDRQITVHDEYKQPYRYSWHSHQQLDHHIKTPQVRRELFTRVLTGYLYNYFSAYSQVSLTEFKTDPKLHLNFRTQDGSGCNVTDSRGLVTKDGVLDTVDPAGLWLNAAASRGFVNTAPMQALAYLMRYRFDAPDYDSDNKLIPHTKHDSWKFPSFLKTFEEKKNFPASGNGRSWRTEIPPMYLRQGALFEASRNALNDLLGLMYNAHSDVMFKNRSFENRDNQQRGANSNQIRVVPYGALSYERSCTNRWGYGEAHSDQTKDGVAAYMTYAEWSENYNCYFPRTIVLSILSYYVRSGDFTQEYADSILEKAFTLKREPKWGEEVNPIDAGAPETPADAHEVLLESRFSAVYYLVRKFFMDRYHRLQPAFTVCGFESGYTNADYFYARRGQATNERNQSINHPHTLARQGLSPSPGLNNYCLCGDRSSE